jgi:RimJ/RimL family protein N-acetyltransferase
LFHELNRSEFDKVSPLLANMDEHLVLASILGGGTPARVFVDHPSHPETVFTGFHARMFLSGSPGNSEFNQSLSDYLNEQVILQAKVDGRGAFIFHLGADAWLPRLEQILAGRELLPRTREFYRCAPRRQDWKDMLPEGFQIRPVNARLLEETGLQHMDLLVEELCSERISVQDFLDKSFGFVVQHGDELVGWCLSEYNQAGCCEVGVATLEPYQRQGLGTAATLALLDHAARLKYRQVGWHCWRANLPSGALARRAGFDLVKESQVYLVLF